MPNRKDIDELAGALANVSERAKERLLWLFESIDQRHPGQLRDVMLEVLPALVREHGEQAIAVAADWYEGIRLREIGGRHPRVIAADTYPDAAVANRVRSAMGHAYRGDSKRAIEVLTTSIDKYIKQAARDTITNAADRDGVAWARVPRGATTCGFCLMLASRGWAYTSEHAAFYRGDGKKYHGNCDCQPVPKFGNKTPKIDGYDPETLYTEYLDARKKVGADPAVIADEMGRRAAAEEQSATGAASRLLDQARSAEPGITEALANLADDVNGELQGLEFRLKSLESLTRKIEADMLMEGATAAEAASAISDALRYTVVTDPRRYTQSTRKVLAELEAQGWSLRVKNFWEDSTKPYQGVNVAALDPNGQPVEVQFHTPQSFDVKNGAMHKLYEEFREVSATEARRAELEREMWELSRGIEVPHGILNMEESEG